MNKSKEITFDSNFAYIYATKVIKGILPEELEKIAFSCLKNDIYFACRYAIEVKKDKLYEDYHKKIMLDQFRNNPISLYDSSAKRIAVCIEDYLMLVNNGINPTDAHGRVYESYYELPSDNQISEIKFFVEKDPYFCLDIEYSMEARGGGYDDVEINSYLEGPIKVCYTDNGKDISTLLSEGTGKLIFNWYYDDLNDESNFDYDSISDEYDAYESWHGDDFSSV